VVVPLTAQVPLQQDGEEQFQTNRGLRQQKVSSITRLGALRPSGTWSMHARFKT